MRSPLDPAKQTRRQFVETSSATVAALLTGSSLAQEHHPSSAQTHGSATTSQLFNFGQIYTPEEAKGLLRSGQTPSLAAPTPVGLPFWWDPSMKRRI